MIVSGDLHVIKKRWDYLTDGLKTTGLPYFPFFTTFHVKTQKQTGGSVFGHRYDLFIYFFFFRFSKISSHKGELWKNIFNLIFYLKNMVLKHALSLSPDLLLSSIIKITFHKEQNKCFMYLKVIFVCQKYNYFIYIFYNKYNKYTCPWGLASDGSIHALHI